MLHRTRRFSSALVVLFLIVASCGGGDEADAGGGNSSDFGPASTVGNVAGMSSECESLTNLSIAMTSMFTGSPEEVDRLLEGVTDVPGDLADEVDLLQTAIRSLALAWSEIGENPLTNPAVLTEMSDADRERIEEVMDEFSDDATNDAFDRIGEYAVTECIAFSG